MKSYPVELMADWRFWKRGGSSSQADRSKILRTQARDLYNSKDFENAAPVLRELLELNPNDDWALDVFSRLLMNTRNYAEAITILQNLIKPGPDLHVYQSRLIRCLYNSGKHKQAVDHLQQMIENKSILEEDWDVLYRGLPKVYSNSEIDKFWMQLGEQKLTYPQIEIEMIRIDLQSSQLGDAANRIQNVTMKSDDIQLSNKWKLKLVKVLIEQDSPLIAEQLISEIPESTPEYTRTLIQVKQALGDNDGAMQTAVSALEEKTDHGVMFAAMRLAWDLGTMEEVVKFTEMIISDKPTQKVAHRFRLRALVKIGNVDRIISAVENSLQLLSDFIEGHRVMIDIAFHEFENWDMVSKHCKSILEIDSNDRRAICHLIHAQIQIGAFDYVKSLIEESTDLHPDDDEVDLTSAHAHWKIGTGRHIERINRMLQRHNLAPIYSIDEDNCLSVEFLRCDPPASALEEPPLVSVIMTVYGRDDYLDVAMDSILNQTHKNLELIVVDDCSPDDAYDYLKKRASEDPRIKAIQVERNGGTYCAKNSAISIARGEYIAFMDSDDWTHPQRIQRQIQSIHNTKIKAICHSYFRINEFGDIFYKGVGAIRLACISLLAKRSVFEKIGHFDSMRVGADTEFIERIKAAYGDDAVLHDKIPSMFMLNHSSSLTGGGRFQISWRSITGARLEHHSAFKAWHKKIRFGGHSPYVEFPLRVRPYTIPEEMTAGDIHWREGEKLFSEHIVSRNQRWWMQGKPTPWQGQLSEKTEGRLWAEKQGIQVPKLIWSGKELSDIPKLSELPNRVVIKPSKGFSSNNVLCLIDRKNILDGSIWDDEMIQTNFSSDEFLDRVQPKWIVEEFLQPEPFREDEIIPRDWKFYCFGEEIALIHVVLRKSETDIHQNIHHYFSGDLRQLQRRVSSPKPVPEEPLYFPECWDEMVTQVKTLGKELGCFMRIDMYATSRGPVFGEFTPTPHGGSGYTEWADKYLATYWKGLEGVKN